MNNAANNAAEEASELDRCFAGDACFDERVDFESPQVNEDPLPDDLMAMLPVVARFVFDAKQIRNVTFGVKRIAAALVGTTRGMTWESLHDVPGYGILQDRCSRNEVVDMIDELVAWDVLRIGGDLLVRLGPNAGDLLTGVNLDDIRPKRIRSTRTRRKPLPTVPASEDDREHMRVILEFINEEIDTIGFGYGKGKTIKALQGTNSRDLDGTRLRELSGFGSMRGLDYRTVLRPLETLLQNGVLQRTPYGGIKPTGRYLTSDVSGELRIIDPDALAELLDERRRALQQR